MAAAVLVGGKRHWARASRSDPGAGPRTLSPGGQASGTAHLPARSTNQSQVLSVQLVPVLGEGERRPGAQGLGPVDGDWGLEGKDGGLISEPRGWEGEASDPAQLTGKAQTPHTHSQLRGGGTSHSPPLHTPPPTSPRPPHSFKGNLVILSEMKGCARGAIRTPGLCDPAQRITLYESQFPEMEMEM